MPSSGRTGGPRPLCAELEREGWGAHVTEVTGLLIDPYFSATKLAWLLANVPGLREKAARRRGLLRHDRQLSAVQADGRGNCTRQMRPTRRAQCCSIFEKASGTTRFSTGSAIPPACCPRCAIRRRFRSDGREPAFRRGASHSRRRRRSAGGGQRAGLRAARHDQGDLRHRLLRRRQYGGQQGAVGQPHAVDHSVPGARAREPSPWRARSSWPVPPCNGCATISA